MTEAPWCPFDHGLPRYFDVPTFLYKDGRQVSPEEQVRQWVLNELLARYGYPASDCRLEYSIRVGTTTVRADIVVLCNEQPWIVIETKSRQHAIEDAELRQALSYATLLRAPYVLVTNGKEWLSFLLHSAHRISPIGDIPVSNQGAGPRLTWWARASLQDEWQDNPLASAYSDGYTLTSPRSAWVFNRSQTTRIFSTGRIAKEKIAIAHLILRRIDSMCALGCHGSTERLFVRGILWDDRSLMPRNAPPDLLHLYIDAMYMDTQGIIVFPKHVIQGMMCNIAALYDLSAGATRLYLNYQHTSIAGMYDEAFHEDHYLQVQDAWQGLLGETIVYSEETC